AVSEQVVLFHDDPPQGPGASEVLDTGLGICRGAVVFPEPEKRLRLDRKDLVARMARRFSPCFCLALPARSRITWRAGRFDSSRGLQWLRADGETVPFEPQEALRLTGSSPSKRSSPIRSRRAASSSPTAFPWSWEPTSPSSVLGRQMA